MVSPFANIVFLGPLEHISGPDSVDEIMDVFGAEDSFGTEEVF